MDTIISFSRDPYAGFFEAMPEAALSATPPSPECCEIS
jgi:hypothetical protein